MPSLRTKKLPIHGHFVEEAADKIDELSLMAVIVGASKRWGDAMEIEIQYEKEERNKVRELEDFLDDHWTELGYPSDWAEEEGDEYGGNDGEEEEDDDDDDDEEDDEDD